MPLQRTGQITSRLLALTLTLATSALTGTAITGCSLPSAGGGPGRSEPANSGPVNAEPASSAVGARGPGRDAPSSLPVAINLVSTLLQLDGYSPYDTTVQANAPRSEFGARLTQALEIAGYGMQVVSADQGRNYLAYRSSLTETETGERVVFEMQLGFVSLSREMRILDGRYVPASPVTIRGADPVPIALNGSVFVAVPDRALTYPSGVRFLADDGTLRSQALFDYAYQPTGEASGGSRPVALEPARFLRQAAGRLYDRGDAVSGSLALRAAEDFTALKALTIRFPSGSDELLGQGNRNALEALSRHFDVANDRITVLSCTVRRGSSDATVARSARVKAELLTLGIPGAQVLELGCPGDTRRSVARRGILVTIERLKASAIG